MQLSKILYPSMCALAIAAIDLPALADPGHGQGQEHKAEGRKPEAQKPEAQKPEAAKPTAAKVEKVLTKLETLAKARKDLMLSMRQGETALARAAQMTQAAKQKLQQRARNPKTPPTEFADLSKEVIVKHDDTVAQVSVLEGASQQLESTEAELAQLVAEAEKQAADAKTNADAAMVHARELAVADREARKNLMKVRAQAGLGNEGAMKARKEKLGRDRETWKQKRAQSDALVQEAHAIPAPTPTPTPVPAAK